MNIFKRFLQSLLLVFFLPSLAFAQADLQKIRISKFEGGAVSNYLADILQPNQGASMVNVEINQMGRLSKRKGQSLFNVDVGNTAFTGLGRFDPDATTSYIVVASGTNVARSQVSSTSWTAASATGIFTSGKNTEFVQANDLLFILNGFDNTAWYNGSSLVMGNVYPSSPPTASTGAWLRNYLFLAGATTENDWIYFSNNLEPKIFSSGDVIKINTGDGQKIQRLEPYRLNELIVYKERSVFVLDITGSTPLTDWTAQPITTVIGTIAPRSVVSLGNDQWFLSSEPIAVRSLVRSSFDKILVDMVSQPIQDVFDGTSSDFAINRTHISKAAGILFNNKFLLAIPTGTSTVNNTVAVYDFIVRGWYLITGWYPAEWIVFDNDLYMIDANDGRVVKCFSGTTGDFPIAPGFVDSASVPSVGINFQYISPNIDFGNPENFKILDALEVTFEDTGNYTASVGISLDDSDFATIGTVNLAGDSRVLPATLPFALSTAGVARKTFQTQQYGEWKKMRVNVFNYASQESVILNSVTPLGLIRKWRRE